MSKRDELYRWHYRALAEKCAKNLEKNRFSVKVVDTKEEARDYVLSLCREASSVGFGGSLTVAELGIFAALKESGKELLNHGLPDLSPEERNEIRRKQQSCDLFLTSTNALTLDGKLVNIDGTGNRVNAMAFGPGRTLVVAGGNKIVLDVERGIKRIKDYVAPMNAKRLGYDTPCAKTGICADCSSPQRICNVTTILEKCPPASRIEVLIVCEPLGL
ncbi:MAG: lactate utilization protein [Deltaproteobacteria bacterium]|nr:MAG: lactate utilization protein [Deltaproteobacteria bacterium]